MTSRARVPAQRDSAGGARGGPIGPPWAGWAPSAVATAAWLVAVVATGMSERVVGHWESAVTMAAGSFLTGSSPLGGGAVAFPVFTKLLDVPPPVARTFGLSIQSVGMTMAAVSIVLARRTVHWRAVVIGSIVAGASFLVGVFALGDAEAVFWPSVVPGAWVKATFSIVLATTSILMVRHLAHGEVLHPPLGWSRRLDLVVVVVAAGGGLLSSMTGTGANILLFLALVVLADVRPSVALPSAIMVMASVSVVGFVLLGLVDGQLDVAVAGGQVVSVGDRAVALAANEADLLGLWLAATPVVVWGAPLGSLAASLVRERHLVRFVAVLAFVEVVTTFLLVTELRQDPALIAYLVGGLALVPALFIALRYCRHRLLAPSGAERSVVDGAVSP